MLTMAWKELTCNRIILEYIINMSSLTMPSWFKWLFIIIALILSNLMGYNQGFNQGHLAAMTYEPSCQYTNPVGGGK